MIQSVGHENTKVKLKKMIQLGTVANSYLFVGRSGIGKKMVAIEFAKMILCDSPQNGEACNHCTSCMTFENNSDFKIIYPEKDTIKVDMIRELIEEIFLLPTISRRKVFIIDDADKMNEQAQNALLKVLEEPPTYATIILVASNKEKLLNTIKSRVVEFQLDGLSPEELTVVLNNHHMNPDLIQDAICFSNGSAENALKFIQDDNFEIAKEIAKVLLEKNFLKIHQKFEEIKTDKALKGEISSILEMVMNLYYQKLKEDISFPYQLIEILEKTIENMKKNANVDLALDILALDVCNFS